MEATPNYEAMGACRIRPTNGLVLLRPNGRPIPMTLANWLMRSVSPISAAWLKRLIVTIWLMVRHAPSSRCARGGRYETCVQLIDPDRLSNPHGLSDGMVLTNGNRIFQGVEVDEQGAAVAYHIRCRHPNDLLSTDNFRWERVQREFR